MFKHRFSTHTVRTVVSILAALAFSGCGTVPAAMSADQVVESLQHHKGAL